MRSSAIDDRFRAPVTVSDLAVVIDFCRVPVLDSVQSEHYQFESSRR